jgi:hypothetical protein
MLFQVGGEKYTHFETSGHVQMAKSDPEAQTKSYMSMGLDLESSWNS